MMMLRKSIENRVSAVEPWAVLILADCRTSGLGETRRAIKLFEKQHPTASEA